MQLPDILLVADKIGLKHKKSGIGSEYFICPFCADKDGHLNIVPEANVWRCCRCGESGGVLDLIQKAGNMSREDAKSYARSLTNAEVIVQYKPRYKGDETVNQRAPKEVIDKTYRTMLSLLSLAEQDKQDLLKRGLSEKAIEKLMIKTSPEHLHDHEICDKLLEAGCTLQGVPGFFISKNGEWTLNNFVNGYMVPFVDVDGYLTGIQTRDRAPKKSTCKYISLSSTGMTGGAKSLVPAHYIGKESPRDADAIILTEGALKADVATWLWWKLKGKKVSFLAIPGVSNKKVLEKALDRIRKMGGDPILYDAFDMDKCGNETVKENPNVAQAIKKVYEVCGQYGFQVRPIRWKGGKGIDDYLLEKITDCDTLSRTA